MPKFLCILRSPSGGCEQPASPPDMEQLYAKFNAWRETFSENIVDLGGRLASEGLVVRAESRSDGPFIESKEIVGGFMILEAESLAAAAEIATQCPGVAQGETSLELREIHTP